MAQIKVTQIKGTIGCTQKQKANVEALGLKKIRDSKVHYDTPIIRGMVRVVNHLVTVEELPE